MTNKEQIIEEILSLEPDLKSRKKELSTLIENIIKTKPDVKISKKFRNDLKFKLLTTERNSLFKSTKKSYIQTVMGFLAGGVVTFSIAGIMGINFNYFDDTNTQLVLQENQAMPVGATTMIARTKMLPSISKTSTSSIEEVSVISDTSIPESYNQDENSVVSVFSESMENNINNGNPATEFCLESGGEIISEGYTNFCFLEDGYKCEEWSYFSGECRFKIEITNFLESNDLDLKYLEGIIGIMEKYRY